MEIIDINWNPRQQNEKKHVKPPKWPKQNHRNKNEPIDQNETTDMTQKYAKNNSQ